MIALSGKRMRWICVRRIVFITLDKMNPSSVLRIARPTLFLKRNLNCWTAGITKKHRAIYERTYPATLVLPDGSSINIEYHEPIKVIKLPLNLDELSEAERKRRLEKRRVKTKIVLEEEEEDSFDENKYLNFHKK